MIFHYEIQQHLAAYLKKRKDQGASKDFVAGVYAAMQEIQQLNDADLKMSKDREWREFLRNFEQ